MVRRDSERAEAQSFWNAFFAVFGLDRRRVASFEKQVAITRTGQRARGGRIDGFWKGVLLIEHKSAGQNLTRAFAQAVDYCDGIAERDLPLYVIVSDFARLRLADFDSGDEVEFAVRELHKHIRRFAFIAANDLQIVPGATGYELGMLSSAMHVAWVRATAGRLESRIRYSAKYTYNTFPWPESMADARRAAIEAAAQVVLDTRSQFPGSTLADLYDPLTMPPSLLRAHQKLDTAVDPAYGKKGFKSDAERVAFLFDLYRKYSSLLPGEPTRRARRRAIAA